MEWLALWGAQQLSGFAFRAVLDSLGNVLGDLAQDAGKDFVKDFFKDALKDGINRFKQDALAVAMGQAVTQFLYLVQQELEGAGVRKADLQPYNPALQTLIHHKPVKVWLAQAFEPGCQSLDGKRLRQVWAELKLPALPEDFSWGKIGRVYWIRVDDLIGESQDLKELFAARKLGAIDENTQQLAGVVPDFDLERYRESLQETYGRLKLNAIDTTYQDYKVRLWRVFVPQHVREALPPSRYELPKDVQQRLQDAGLLEAEVLPDASEQYQRLFLEKPVHPVLEMLRQPDCQYAVILGDPGAGKSSLLQYLALDWAENPTAEIPLLIELRQYVTDENQPQDFLEFFHQGRRTICELNQLQLHEQLQSGKALVMFDGLDGIFDPHRREGAITEIIAFTNKYKRVRVVVTSRIVGYNSELLGDAEFRHFTLEDFNSGQIRQFIKQWHQLALVDETDRERAEIRQRLQTAIQDSPAIRALAGNPLLLTMMAILNRKQELPRKRADLYEESAKVLLYQWDIEYKKLQLTLDDVDLRAKQAMLRRVAFRMQASAEGLQGNIIHRDELEAELADYLRSREIPQPLTVAGKLIEQLRRRDFILCHLGNDYFAFVHRTFLEYFCATEFVERFGKRGTAGGLPLEQLQTEVFGQHWPDKSWHEVLRLIVGNENIDVEFAGAIVAFLAELQTEADEVAPLLLAADCYGEIENKTKIPAVGKTLLDKLKAVLEDVSKPETLGKTQESSQSVEEEGDSPAVRLRKLLEKHSKRESLDNKDYGAITRKIVTLFWENTEVKSWLEEKALNHKNSNVRSAIAKGIAAVELPHVQSELINNLGDVYHWQNRYEDAIAVYLNLNLTASPISKFGLIKSYINLKRYDEAIAYCNQWIEGEPKSQWAYDQLGKGYRESGHYSEAIAAYNQAIAIAEKTPVMTLSHRQGLVWTYQDMGQYESAISAAEQTIAIDPANKFNSGTHNNLGMVYQDLGHDEAAISAFQQAIALDSTNKTLHNNLGCLYRSLERWEEAIEAFQTAIEIDPKYANPYAQLGVLFLLQRELDRAEPELTMSIEINPYYGNGILRLGLLQALRGDLVIARATWQRGLALYPEHALDCRLLRTVYVVALGNTDLGIARLRQILQQEQPPSGLLHQVLEIAQLLQRCPDPIFGISQVVSLLEWGMQQAPVFEWIGVNQ